MSDVLSDYDAVAYSNHSYPNTHPGHLATLGRFYGMQPVPIHRRRVLELGCGAGGNLIPIAYQCPDSEFLGLDLNARAIQRGRADIDAMGLTNIALRQGDLRDFSTAEAPFDYIIAHGFYSWVPPAVREKLLAVCRITWRPRALPTSASTRGPTGTCGASRAR